MNPLTTVGRIIFGIPMIVFGILHFLNSGMMAGMVPGFVPGGVIWVYITGVALIAGGLALIANFQAFYGALLLAVLMFTFALTIHLPAVLGGDQAALSSLLKDTMLGSGALVLAGLFRPSSA